MGEKLNTRNKTGFTLIELLVVVLIIGILTAIGMPMYQRAVVKTKVATAISTIKGWEKIYDQYILANGCSYVCDLSNNLNWDTFTTAVKGYSGQVLDPATTSMREWVEIDIGGWKYISDGMGGIGVRLNHSKDGYYNLDQKDLMYSIEFLPPNMCNPIHGSCSASWITGPGRLVIDLPSTASKEVIGPILKDLGAQEGQYGLWFL